MTNDVIYVTYRFFDDVGVNIDYINVADHESQVRRQNVIFGCFVKTLSTKPIVFRIKLPLTTGNNDWKVTAKF